MFWISITLPMSPKFRISIFPIYGPIILWGSISLALSSNKHLMFIVIMVHTKKVSVSGLWGKYKVGNPTKFGE